jgi:hypothetical protein
MRRWLGGNALAENGWIIGIDHSQLRLRDVINQRIAWRAAGGEPKKRFERDFLKGGESDEDDGVGLAQNKAPNSCCGKDLHRLLPSASDPPYFTLI